jgi:hypothetical protein
LAFALIISTRKLRPYFQAHVIRVLTEYPLKKVLQKPDLSGRLVNGAIELGEFDIEFHLRTAIKGQALAYFILEFSNIPESSELPEAETWVFYVDGLFTDFMSGAGVVLMSPKNDEVSMAVKLDFPKIINEAEYEAILAGLRIAKELGAKSLKINSNILNLFCFLYHINNFFYYLNKKIHYNPKIFYFFI